MGGTLVIEIELGRHGTAGAYPAQRYPHRLERIAAGCVRRGWLVAAMRQAVGAFLVLAGAVGLPVRGLHQFLEGLGIALAEQVAGLLPAENVAGRHAPRRAFVILIARQEIQEQAGMHEIPLLAFAQREHVAEQFLGLGAVEEMLLVRRALIGITR